MEVQEVTVLRIGRGQGLDEQAQIIGKAAGGGYSVYVYGDVHAFSLE